MCGIVGFTGNHQAAPILLDGLSKLEYRGYDSAGIAVRDGEGETTVIKAGRRRTNETLLKPYETTNLPYTLRMLGCFFASRTRRQPACHTLRNALRTLWSGNEQRARYIPFPLGIQRTGDSYPARKHAYDPVNERKRFGPESVAGQCIVYT